MRKVDVEDWERREDAQPFITAPFAKEVLVHASIVRALPLTTHLKEIDLRRLAMRAALKHWPANDR